MRYLDRMQPLALLVLRMVLGLVMIAHGSQKLFGGISQYVHWISSMGLPGWMAYLSIGAEFLGGILVVAGLFTRFVALAIEVDMIVAILKVHWKHGLLGDSGYEFPLSLAAIAFALIFFGAGPIALDAIRRSGGGGAKATKG